MASFSFSLTAPHREGAKSRGSLSSRPLQARSSHSRWAFSPRTLEVQRFEYFLGFPASIHSTSTSFFLHSLFFCFIFTTCSCLSISRLHYRPETFSPHISIPRLLNKLTSKLCFSLAAVCRNEASKHVHFAFYTDRMAGKATEGHAGTNTRKHATGPVLFSAAGAFGRDE